MQLTFLPALSQEQFARLCESGEKGGWTPMQVSEAVLAKRWMCFSVGELGLVAVSVKGTTMTVEAMWARNFGWFMRQFRDWMDRLATDWGCNTVESICFDRRLADAMMRIEAREAAWLMQWQVKGLEK